MLSETKEKTAMTLGTNIQKVAAVALREGYGIALPAGYDCVGEHFVGANGKHVGYELLWDFELPTFVGDIISRSRKWLSVGDREYDTLRAESASPETEMAALIERWGEMYRAYFHGALDHVVPFEAVRARILELVGCEPERMELFDILTPDDGRNIFWYHRHPLLLHFAYSFRRCPTGRWIGTYDGFSKAWLDINYLPLSLGDATNVGIDPTEKGIAAELRALRISRGLYERGGEDEEMEEAFQKTREALREFTRKRTDWRAKARAAGRKLLEETPLRARPAAWSLMTLIGASMQLNEEIHYRLYRGLNILRLSAQARGEHGIRMTQAFTLSLR